MIQCVTWRWGNTTQAGNAWHWRQEGRNGAVLWLLLPLLALLYHLLVPLLALLQKKNLQIGLAFIENWGQRRPQPQGIFFVVSVSRIDSIGEHQHALRHRRAGLGLGVGRVGLLDVRKPSSAHGRAKLIAQGINGLGNCGPSVLPHVICKTKILTYLEIIGIISISVISEISAKVL